MTTTGYPDVAAARAWLKVTANSISDDDLTVILKAEIAAQAAACSIPEELPADLYAAVLRRCARAVAARGIPLGVTGATDEYGPTRITAYDAEIERYEGAHRVVAMG